MIECDGTLSVIYYVWTKITNTIALNVIKICHCKKVRYCHILHTVLLVISFISFISAIDNYYYLLSLYKA